jgi:hypothetical protein
VALQCTFCGTALKDDARYCNHCGTLVATHPFSPKSAHALKFSEQNNNTRESIREQIAQQPTYRSSRRSTQDEPPSWMSHLGDGLQRKVSSEGLEAEPTEQLPEKTMVVPPAVQEFSMDDDPEDLPTKPLVADSPGIQSQRNTALSPHAKMQHAHFDDDAAEYLDTIPLATQMEAKSTHASSPGEAIQRQERPTLRYDDAPNRTPYPGFSPSTPGYLRSVNQHDQERMGVSSATQVQVGRQTPPAQPAVSSFRPSQQRKTRKSSAIVLFLLILLVVAGGVGAWIVLYQPFSMPLITQPQQQLSNTQLGFSLLYPSGWQSQLDRGKATVQLFDSSHTAQVDIVVGAAPNGDLSQYLQQQANQLGMTAIKKGATRSFAGETWQQVQGNVLQSGASYTETLLATTRKSNLFTIKLLAPQTTYTEEEQVAFSKICSSFQFL